MIKNFSQFLKIHGILKHACVYGYVCFCMHIYSKKSEIIFNQNYFSSFVVRLYRMVINKMTAKYVWMDRSDELYSEIIKTINESHNKL